MRDLNYQTGFGNEFASEAKPGALPIGQNTPQKVPFGLYAEQINGSAFTAPRRENLRSWLYRGQPSSVHGQFTAITQDKLLMPPFNSPFSPQQYRWRAQDYPSITTNFIDGMVTFAGHSGAAIHLYACNQSMTDQYFYNADGELLLVPQEGGLHVKTELGCLAVTPGEVIVIPRGIKFQVDLLAKQARGYVCENFGSPFTLPDLGPIGANGLANPRDFNYPTAWFEEKTGELQLLTKFQGQLWQASLTHSPLDVVAWHGNYAPYKYDLRQFCTLNSVSFDHIDPSIFTVLTSPSHQPGTANVDFVIFPSRWMVAERTFRPPYFHRNIMSEFMGLIYGDYDAKPGCFVPGGASLHNCMSAHGPATESYQTAITTDLEPTYYDATLAFMFESLGAWQPSPYALACPQLDPDYHLCWQGLSKMK